MKTIRDGWHTISGFKVYVEGGKIVRGMLGEGCKQVTAYPYRACRRGGWDICTGITVDAFRAGGNRRTITLF